MGIFVGWKGFSKMSKKDSRKKASISNHFRMTIENDFAHRDTRGRTLTFPNKVEDDEDVPIGEHQRCG